MIPTLLKLSNFTSYGEGVHELDFTKFHLAAISGTNGAGKSSILDAITWCLWGWSRSGDSSDQLIHSGDERMQVDFSFDLDGREFTVKRSRSLKSGGTTALEFWSTKNNLTEGIIKATQEKIIETLHLTFETFINSSFIRQGHADEFTTKGPNDRKRILADILGLSHYDSLEEKAKDRAKAAQTKLQLLDYQLLDLETELSQKDEHQKQLNEAQQKVSVTESQIKSYEEEIKILQKEKEVTNLALEQRVKLEQSLSSQKLELDQILLQGKERSERIKNLENAIQYLPELDKKVDSLKKSQIELDNLKLQNQKRLELEKSLAELKGNLDLKLQQISQIKDELKKLKLQIKDLEKPSAKCPTCGQEVGKDNKHKVIDALELKLTGFTKKLSTINIAEEESDIKKLESQLPTLKVDPVKLGDLENNLSELLNLQTQREKTLQDKASLETEQKTRLELLSLYKSKDEQVKKLERELNSLPKVSEDQSQVSLKFQEKESSLEKLRGDEKEIRNLLGRATELISRAEQLEKTLIKLKTEKTLLQKAKENFDELSLAFGKKGIQAMIIETAIPEIEMEANSLLGKLTNGRMQVRFDTQRESKTQSIIETLDIIISDEMGERPYENYSGGEQFRINVAIRLALSKLLTRRAGAKLQFLVIDEGFGTQDAEGRTKIVEVLDIIKNDFEKILVITHLEELKEEFPIRIEVSKGTTGSTFEVVGD